MKVVGGLSLILAAILIFNNPSKTLQSHVEAGRGINGGIPCAACTVLVGVIEQLSEVHNETITDMVSSFCDLLQGEYKIFCDILVHLWGPAIIEKLNRQDTPDVICYSLGICHVDSGQSYCHLFPEPPGGMSVAVYKSRVKSKVMPFFHWTMLEHLPSVCYLPAVSQICNSISRVLTALHPAIDLDGDKYSIIKTLRGDSWRGKDCDDVNEQVYPGRKTMDADVFFDSNCNGIYGVNPESSMSYEDELCAESDMRGLIYIGDSVGAHFHLPYQWLDATLMTSEMFKNFSFILANELDWPQTSFSTGHVNVSWPVLDGPTDSIYLKLRERNRCNHRDFQNICFNGADSLTMIPQLSSISRRQKFDKPVIAFYAMMGNDVCRCHMDSPDELTTPKQFRENVMTSLNILNETLPHGSHVVLMGLVNGSFIYPTMANRIHPIGQLHQDVKYSDIYEWFNCMQMGPCFGWMNKDETYRTATTNRAMELSRVLQDIVANENFKAFDLYYMDNPLHKVMIDWQKAGNDLWRFMEPADSLHPIQEVQPYLAQVVWDELHTKYPHVLGRVNPNNERIQELFGDQGGY